MYDKVIGFPMIFLRLCYDPGWLYAFEDVIYFTTNGPELDYGSPDDSTYIVNTTLLMDCHVSPVGSGNVTDPHIIGKLMLKGGNNTAIPMVPVHAGDASSTMAPTGHSNSDTNASADGGSTGNITSGGGSNKSSTSSCPSISPECCTLLQMSASQLHR